MLKLGFIGCGGIARHHAGTILREVKGIRIAAGADLSAKARRLFREVAGEVDLYSDYDAMLRKADIDAVCVALPTGLHRQATVSAARRGKHVFCEKPMAMSLRDCDRMIAATEKADVKLMVGHVRRYDRDWGTWKKLVESGTIGRPVHWRQLSGGGQPGTWFLDARMGGGPFLDGCVHNWDYANWVFGEPKEAVGSLMRLASTTALDTGAVVVRYASGDEVVMCWSWGLPKGVRAGGISELLGPKGVIHFPGFLANGELPKGFDPVKQGAYCVQKPRGKRIVTFRRADMFAEEWRDFRDAIAENRAPQATAEGGRRAVAVGLAVLEAGRTRKPVKIA